MTEKTFSAMLINNFKNIEMSVSDEIDAQNDIVKLYCYDDTTHTIVLCAGAVNV